VPFSDGHKTGVFGHNAPQYADWLRRTLVDQLLIPDS